VTEILVIQSWPPESGDRSLERLRGGFNTFDFFSLAPIFRVGFRMDRKDCHPEKVPADWGGILPLTRQHLRDKKSSSSKISFGIELVFLLLKVSSLSGRREW